MLTNRLSRGFAAALLCCAGLAVSPATAQNFPETEPNDTKFAGNAVGPMAPSNTITGNSTGTSTTTPGTTSSDNYLVTVEAPPSVGIWRYRLVISTAGTAGHTGSIRGLTQTAGVINAGSDSAFQTSSTTTTPARFNQWYGLGGGTHQIFYRVTGGSTTTADYVSTLERTQVTPVLGPTDIIEGNVRISTIAQGHTTDTDLWVYDSNFSPVATFGNDDESAAGGGTGATLQSTVARTLTPGTYYVAISNFGFANNQPAPTDDDFRTGTVLDFANAAANSSTSSNVNVSLAITGGTGSVTPVALTRSGPYDVVWLQFQVVPATSPTNPTGVGSATPSSVANDGSGTTTLAVTVTPGTNPPSTAHTVTVTSASLVGGSVALLDNGVAPDVTAGDNIFTASATVVNGTPIGALSLPYTIQETAPLARTGNGNINVTVILPPPTNDVCGSAITVGTGTTVGDNSQATTDSAATCQTSSNKDLWYDFTAPSAGAYQFDTEGSVQGDTVLSLFDACGGTELACDDDSGTGFLSNLAFTLTSGQNVKIRVASFGTAPTGGVFNLNINPTVVGACCNLATGACVLSTSGAGGCASGATYLGDNTVCNTTTCPVPPPPANDECTSAVALTVGVAGNGLITNATGTDITNCSGSDIDVWFSITPAAGNYSVTTTPSSASDDSTAIAVFTSCPPTALGEIACAAQPGIGATNTTNFAADGTTTYFIRAAGFTGDVGAFTILVNPVTAGACCNFGTGGCTIVTTGVCPTGATYLGDNTVCNTTTCPVPPPPANDLCASAIVANVGTTTGNNAAATTDGAASCQTSSNKDVWYDFTAPAAGSYQMDTEGSVQTDTVLNVFDACGGTELACNDDGGTGLLSLLLINLSNGQNVRIRVASFGATPAGGSFNLNIASITTGACCAPLGTCTITTSTGCTAGTYQGDNTVCVPNDCPAPQPPTNDTCATAIVVTGTSMGNIDTTTAQNENQEPIGSCNTAGAIGIDNSIWFTFTPGSSGTLMGSINPGYDGVMVLLTGGPCGSAGNFTEVACWDEPEPWDLSLPGSGSSALTAGTTYYLVVGDWGTTDGGGATSYTITIPAAAMGRCCIGARCAIVAPAACVGAGTAGASFTAGAADCNAAGTFNTPCCFADYNKSGSISVQDIFDFLTDYFVSSVNANVSGDGVAAPTVQDIFDFLTAYFAGGC